MRKYGFASLDEENAVNKLIIPPRYYFTNVVFTLFSMQKGMVRKQKNPLFSEFLPCDHRECRRRDLNPHELALTKPYFISNDCFVNLSRRKI
jgi:hypothetical protein